MRKFKVSNEKVSNEDQEDETVCGKNGGGEGVIVKAIIDESVSYGAISNLYQNVLE